MQVFFADFCGRWGCSWQEGILILLFLHPKVAIFLICMLIIFILWLLFIPIILIQDMNNNKKTDSDKIPRRIAFSIKGVQVVSKLRHKNISDPNAVKNNEQQISPK